MFLAESVNELVLWKLILQILPEAEKSENEIGIKDCVMLCPNCFDKLFYNSILYKPPVKITGFNDFSLATTVSHTYYQAFGNCSYIQYLPQTDFSVVVPYMCYEMYQSCYAYITNATNSATGFFATEFAPHCFERMFCGCRALTTAPTIIGSTNKKAADYCCYQMFSDCYNLKSVPNIACSEGANYSFSGCFGDCSSLTHVIFSIVNLGAHTGTFNDCFGSGKRLYSLTEISFPLLTLSSIDWPIGMFDGWVGGVDTIGVLSCTQSVANAIGDTRGQDYIPDGWSIRVINY